MCALCASLGVQAIAFGQSGYPVQLADIPDPPAVLFYIGSVELLCNMRSVAVIGSRRCSVYGRTTARQISMRLCQSGACVVSGLARGIDGEAHRGALDGGGPTVAVMGGGLDVIYPPEHARLAAKIAGNGCLVSEYPPGIRPAKYTFPERNRIISGLCTALIVVEAGERSGTMITVGTALDQGRDVYAVPGELGRSTSRGTNRLLRDGAGIVLSPEELMEELNLIPRDISAPTDPILVLLCKKNLTIEMLSVTTGEPLPALRQRILELELRGLVMRRPGNTFTAVKV
jgi:DNA processing protein